MKRFFKRIVKFCSLVSIPYFSDGRQNSVAELANRQARHARIEKERMGKVSNDKPFFRFNPRAYELEGTFVESKETCDVCDEVCVWEYASRLYAAFDDFTICARCISEGRISDAIKGEHFSFHDADISGLGAELLTELEQRTPGFATFNPFHWPTLEGMPLAFIGYGEETVIINDTQAQLAIVAAFRGIFDDSEIGTPNHYALVFKQIGGDQYVVERNFD